MLLYHRDPRIPALLEKCVDRNEGYVEKYVSFSLGKLYDDGRIQNFSSHPRSKVRTINMKSIKNFSLFS